MQVERTGAQTARTGSADARRLQQLETKLLAPKLFQDFQTGVVGGTGTGGTKPLTCASRYKALIMGSQFVPHFRDLQPLFANPVVDTLKRLLVCVQHFPPSVFNPVHGIETLEPV